MDHKPPVRFSADIAIVGGGAAGLAVAIFAARQRAGLDIAVLDGAKKLGAKILVSGGGRCNVTNRVVTQADFRGGSPHLVRRVLSALPVDDTITFFNEIGVALHEEEHGKLFPDTHKARSVLDALLAEAARRGVRVLADHRVLAVTVCEGGFEIVADRPPIPVEGSGGPQRLLARRVVLATGGLSLPKTGSDGAGYGFAQGLGHSLVPRTPALAPLVLDGDFHAGLSGIAHEVQLTMRVAGTRPARLRGSMLWTHFGVSGPVVLDASGLWHRARLAERDVALTANLLPSDDFQSAKARFIALAAGEPKLALKSALAKLVPARVADAALKHLGIPAHVPLAHLAREDRRTLVHALLDWPLPVKDSRGYAYAEVTAGGVPLNEIDVATMESRKCPGLYLVGEVLDVDGRIGGFNFQWAWASGFVAGRALASWSDAMGAP